MGAISFIETMEANSLSITKEEFDNNIERTMTELKRERPSVTIDKQQINYENTVHPSRIQSQPLLLDPAKASALLERGSQFAQKTMQRPLSFVGKIFQGLSDSSSSRPQSPDEFQPITTIPAAAARSQLNHHPDPIEVQRLQFMENLEILNNMFTNVDDGVCDLILKTNQGDLAKSIDQ